MDDIERKMDQRFGDLGRQMDRTTEEIRSMAVEWENVRSKWVVVHEKIRSAVESLRNGIF